MAGSGKVPERLREFWDKEVLKDTIWGKEELEQKVEGLTQLNDYTVNRLNAGNCFVHRLLEWIEGEGEDARYRLVDQSSYSGFVYWFPNSWPSEFDDYQNDANFLQHTRVHAGKISIVVARWDKGGLWLNASVSKFLKLTEKGQKIIQKILK